MVVGLVRWWRWCGIILQCLAYHRNQSNHEALTGIPPAILPAIPIDESILTEAKLRCGNRGNARDLIEALLFWARLLANPRSWYEYWLMRELENGREGIRAWEMVGLYGEMIYELSWRASPQGAASQDVWVDKCTITNVLLANQRRCIDYLRQFKHERV